MGLVTQRMCELSVPHQGDLKKEVQSQTLGDILTRFSASIIFETSLYKYGQKFWVVQKTFFKNAFFGVEIF